MLRTIIMAVVGLGAIVFLTQQLATERAENNLLKSRIEAIAGAREVENVTRQMDDCSLVDLLVGVHGDGRAVQRCAAGTTKPEAGDGGISGSD